MNKPTGKVEKKAAPTKPLRKQPGPEPAPPKPKQKKTAAAKKSAGNRSRVASRDFYLENIDNPLLRGAAMREVNDRAITSWGAVDRIAPAEALLEEVGRTVHFIRDCQRMMDERGGKAVAMFVGYSNDPEVVELAQRAHEVRILMGWWEDARKHLVNVARSSEAGRLAEKYVKLSETNASLIMAVFTAVLTCKAMDWTPQQRKMLPGLIRQEIMKVRSREALAPGEVRIDLDLDMDPDD